MDETVIKLTEKHSIQTILDVYFFKPGVWYKYDYKNFSAEVKHKLFHHFRENVQEAKKIHEIVNSESSFIELSNAKKQHVEFIREFMRPCIYYNLSFRKRYRIYYSFDKKKWAMSQKEPYLYQLVIYLIGQKINYKFFTAKEVADMVRPYYKNLQNNAELLVNYQAIINLIKELVDYKILGYLIFNEIKQNITDKTSIPRYWVEHNKEKDIFESYNEEIFYIKD
ncbi:hypothetical protein UFOVP733_1 [uncultured Caudovirales phage]|uniref:Uncharacterized protein n=1 Tax=uncultured Caudovirales phage TaxID=2100421 RepID=A0A6J7X8B1_9CAUD|nr:hypothetical protein UFOVP733_1 [uncultured Caudovirales phage]CAB5224981.1 hypothetical protein UFOVP743_58 [uncultured Caudovirales phage]